MPQAEFVVKKVERHLFSPQVQPNANGSIPAIFLVPYVAAKVYAERVGGVGAIGLDNDRLEFWGQSEVAEGDTITVEMALVKGTPPDETAILRAQLDAVKAERDLAVSEVRTAKSERDTAVAALLEAVVSRPPA